MAPSSSGKSENWGADAACACCSTQVRAKAVFAAAMLAYCNDEPARGEALCEEGLRLLDQFPGEATPAAVLPPLLSPLTT